MYLNKNQIFIILNKKLKQVVSNNVLSLNFNNKIGFHDVSEKIQKTFVKNWINYWKSLYNDYKEVATNVYKDSKAHPMKTTIYASSAATIYYCLKYNPNEVSFREQLIHSSLKLIQVGETIRNPISVSYIKWLEQCYNEGIIRRLNLGIFSLMWLSNYDSNCMLYKTVCPYLKPQYITFYQRIIDIGFLDNWWVLKNSMIDYDINENEYL